MRFDVDATGSPTNASIVVQPWRRVPLDPAYSGQWVVAGDLDGDGTVEIVSARNVNAHDVHYTSAVVAHRLDGTVIWRWGNPKIGRKKLHHDVACQVYDWDGDGRAEVVLCTKGALVELDGVTGKERRRFPLPKDATDCLTFANLSGGPRATDVLVKTRYSQIWAYSREGKLLWTVKNPGGYRTAHQPRPIDLDDDGRDEVMAGYAMLNADGSTRWVYNSKKIALRRGHLDCMRVVRRGTTPADWRLVVTCCGANGMAMLDGTGKSLWEVAGHHYESVDVGKICPDVPGVQLAVDIDHLRTPKRPLWVFDEQGQRIGSIATRYSRNHDLIDWTGSGQQAILMTIARGLFDGTGRRIATFAMTKPDSPAHAAVGDMTGNGVPDVLLTTRRSNAAYIYRNPNPTKPATPAPLGTPSFTLY